MMRGLACALHAGSCYTLGWALAFHRNSTFLRVITAGFGILAIGVALISALIALSRDSKRMTRAVTVLAVSLLVVFWAGDFGQETGSQPHSGTAQRLASSCFSGSQPVSRSLLRRVASHPIARLRSCSHSPCGGISQCT